MVDDARLDVGEGGKRREGQSQPPLPPLKGSQPGNKRGERAGEGDEEGGRGWQRGRPSEYVCIRGEKNANGESGGNDGGGRNVGREKERERGGKREKAKGREEMVEGGKEEEEGIAEKRQEGGYSRLHPRGSGPSVSPWQPTLKHPPAVALPSHRRELRFPMAVIMYPRSRCTRARC